MRNRFFASGLSSHLLPFIYLCLCLVLLAGCGSSIPIPSASRTASPTTKQVLVFPDVGIQDLESLDPTQDIDANTVLALNMIYSGLVRLDKNLNVIPDQATWTISPDRKIYTFTLKPGLTFSNGAALTAQSYVYSLTRALLPATQSDDAMLFLGNIAGATAVNSGKAHSLSGVKAINATTLEITLSTPTDYFLQALANPLAFPVNQQLVEQYGEADWTNHVVKNGAGSGPFMVKKWEHNTKMVLVPNTHYYGPHTHLSEVDMVFAVDAHNAFQQYQGGQFNFVWNITSSDLSVAHGLAGFTGQSLLQTDALFFNTQMSPFDQAAVRQAFAYAVDKNMLTQSVLNDSAIPASTIVPAGIPGYQPNLTALSFNRGKALSTLKTVYADVSQMPSVTFSYPGSQVPAAVATALQQMWQTALGVQIKLLPVETNAYNIELANHQVQFGFVQWNADFPDPYDVLALDLLSDATGNNGMWQNSQFDQLIQQAEQTSGTARLNLYGQAEQVAISDAAWLPLDHQTMSAVIPATVHGVSVNHLGLYFGDWSGIYLSAR